MIGHGDRLPRDASTWHDSRVPGARRWVRLQVLLAVVAAAGGAGGCGAGDGEGLAIHCANVQQKGWFGGPSRSVWSVLRSDDARVVADATPQATVVRWRIEEEWLTAVTDDDPPVVVAAFQILDHVPAVPDPHEACGYRLDPDDKPWSDQAVFLTDFSRSSLPPPGLFARTAEVEPAGWLGFAEVDEGGPRVDARGGELPLSFVARLADEPEWARVAVRLRWEN